MKFSMLLGFVGLLNLMSVLFQMISIQARYLHLSDFVERKTCNDGLCLNAYFFQTFFYDKRPWTLPSATKLNDFDLHLGWCSSSVFRAISLGFTILWWDFLHIYIQPYFNRTIQVATFRLCGWCRLGVFLLPAFTCRGHECQDLLSLYDGMHVCTD